MPCEMCHANKEKHGDILLKREECLQCHHEKVQADCSLCHRDGIPEPKESKKKVERRGLPSGRIR
jgi:hypothetical protein